LAPGVSYALHMQDASRQQPQFARTVRVRNENRVGVLASVLSLFARHRADIGDIRIVTTGRTHIVRDIDVVLDSPEELAALIADLDAFPMTTMIEVRDEVLDAHAGGKLRMLSTMPVDTLRDLSRIYTPGVGEVSQRVAADPTAAERFTVIGNAVAVVTDGSAVLGLGNLGARAAMPVMEGKCALLAELAGIYAVPILLGTQDDDEIIRAVTAIAPTFGVIQLEDIASPRCFRIEEALIERIDGPVFHDDQHGTAAVTLAALLNATALADTRLEKLRVGQIGLGAAGLAIARAVMHATGNSVMGADISPDALERLRAAGGTPSSLDEIMATCDAVITTTGRPGLIRPEQVRSGQIILALSNPRPEIEPAEALRAGARIAESGAMINNLLCYPGACRGLLDAGATRSGPELFLAASRALVILTPPGHLLPDPLDREVHRGVAQAVAQAAIDAGIARHELDRDYFEAAPALELLRHTL
jgi:malate dehydrogenase (oxaloacetate-decarboxylating)